MCSQRGHPGRSEIQDKEHSQHQAQENRKGGKNGQANGLLSNTGNSTPPIRLGTERLYSWPKSPQIEKKKKFNKVHVT